MAWGWLLLSNVWGRHDTTNFTCRSRGTRGRPSIAYRADFRTRRETRGACRRQGFLLAVKLERGLRFVEAGGNLASAGGLTSGIDLALRVVERYYGTFVAERTAFYMEYQGTGWKDPGSNAVYAKRPKDGGPVCAVCGLAEG